MTGYTRTAAMLLGAATLLASATAANAGYFVRPVLQYGGGEMVDGLSLNGATSRSLTFNDGYTELQSHVKLSDGTLKTRVSSAGPQYNFLIATAIYGDTIRYTGSETDTVSFFVDFDGFINSNQFDMGDEDPNASRYIGIDAYFAVYEAGTGATWDDWTVTGSQKGTALYNDRETISWNNEDPAFGDSFQFTLGDDLFLKNNASYEVYVAFNLLLKPGGFGGDIEMDAMNTARLSINAGNGSFTSSSGELLGFDKTPGGVPEPATWAMLIIGFGTVGAAARRRRALVSA